MPDLNFHVEKAEPVPFAAAPLLAFKLRIAEATTASARQTPVWEQTLESLLPAADEQVPS